MKTLQHLHPLNFHLGLAEQQQQQQQKTITTWVIQVTVVGNANEYFYRVCVVVTRVPTTGRTNDDDDDNEMRSSRSSRSSNCRDNLKVAANIYSFR
jgi:hypothetical protein